MARLKLNSEIIRSTMKEKKRKVKLIYLDDHAYSKFSQFGANSTKVKFLDENGIKYDIIHDWDSLPIWTPYPKKKNRGAIRSNNPAEEGKALDSEVEWITEFNGTFLSVKGKIDHKH